MNLMNGQPVYSRRNLAPLVKYSGFNYEDFCETIKRAKERGQIVDGPPSELTPYKSRTNKSKVETRSCHVCQGKFECKISSVAKGCSPACTTELRSRAAKARVTRPLCPVCGLERLKGPDAKACSVKCIQQLKPPTLPMCPVCNTNRLRDRDRRTCSAQCSMIFKYEKAKAKA
jgi:predicted nucleic acid-binding Zn ribbon protein